MIKRAPRVMIAGTGSGCGKTTVMCAVLQAMINRGLDVASFKCGPDYIDPMFHSEIIGAPCTNVDLYFADEQAARGLFLKHSAALNVIEGVMGYYDGLAMQSAEASGWHAAKVLSAPTVLVVNARGMALSAAAVVKGFQMLRDPNGIAGVILNQVSPMSYPQLKDVVERECGVKVYGYMPTNDACRLESRHLGLVTAQEVEGLKGKMHTLAEQAEKSIDIDGLIGLMCAQSEMEGNVPAFEKIADVRIAVAKDRAFCFYYRDNLDLLEELGATLIPFSPLEDRCLPVCDGLYLGGGYPELYREKLAQNTGMRESVRKAVTDGLPVIAECGGFMYLTKSIAGSEMAGVINTECSDAHKLVRFGYAELSADTDNMILKADETVRGHEFHHWDASMPGKDLTGRKTSGRSWKCAYATDSMYAGYPHLYFYSNTDVAERFVMRCHDRRLYNENRK